MSNSENYLHVKQRVLGSWRRAGLYPLIPEAGEERNMFKTKYRETGKIPFEL